MRIVENYSLETHNTFHLPVRARWFMEYDDEEELGRILRDEYFRECRSLHIGEGSNLLFVNDFDGVILHSRIKGITSVEEDGATVLLRVGAAERWDDVVAWAVSRGYGGVENLSLIPGEAGAAAIQNIGAYGVEIGDVLETAEAWNRLTLKKRVFTNAECAYAYRHSYFKEERNDPYIVTHITLRLRKNPGALRIAYGELREELGDTAPLSPAAVRDAVIAIRRRKLPDPAELGNAGSFFMNPLVDAEQAARLQADCPGMPQYPTAGGRVKLSAGWLIEQCGFKGRRCGAVGVYGKQALVLVNHGGADGHAIALLAESIRTAVAGRFGVELIPEVKYVS